MIPKISLLILAAAVTCGCQQSKTALYGEQTQNTVSAATLETHLQAAASKLTTDSVQLTFTVVNHSSTMQRFCKWETPFEPRLGKYLEVTDEKGAEATFMGAMARRKMPPSPESYVEVPPNDSIMTVFNMATNYSIRPGRYTVKYIGGGISGLPSGNKLNITIMKL